MDIIFSLLILGLLVALGIHFLYRYQKKAAREQLERSDPLLTPDLDFGADFSVAPRQPPPQQRSAPEDWQTAAREARDAGQLDTALRLCQRQFPRAQAFRQAMICIRASLRESTAGDAAFRQHLGRLYRYAVVADLFGRKSTGGKRNRTRRQLAAGALEDLSISYDLIGYRYLRLLTKTDITLLREHWGEPERHAHAEAVLGADWENQLQLFGSAEEPATER